jgi:hypothetical protein
MRNPITPRNDEAPVGTAGITRTADAALRKSMKRIGQRVKVMLNKIPTQEITINADTEYRYLIAPASIFQLADDIGDIIEQETDNGEMLEPYGVSSFNLGTTQAIANLAAQVATYPITPESLQFSQPHQARINIVRSRMFEEMQNLNSTMKANLNRILVQGISEGQNPRVIARQIYQEAGIPEWNSGNNKASFARALRVARTEINHAHREAGRAQDRDANALGIKTKLLWFSALLPTTRKTHARRHGHYYTREEVERFYSRDGNSVNCRCSQRSLVLDENDEPYDPTFIERLQKKGKVFFND